MSPKLLQRRYVVYYRVSTAKQGRSGLGLDAQKTQVAAFIERTSGRVLKAFTEVESGKDNDRPELHAALKYCALTNCTLLVAKLDRLSRNAAFLLNLQDSKVRFVACDMPDMNETVVGILAVVAQDEARRTSERTKAALQAAKERGVKLGSPSLQPGTRKGALKANAAKVQQARERAEQLREIVEEGIREGHRSLRFLQAYLNECEVTTPRGKAWTPIAVSRLLSQLKIDTAALS